MLSAERLANRFTKGEAAYVLLSVYRGFAAVVAIFQIFFVRYSQPIVLHHWILLAVVGAYTLFKVSRPLRDYKRNAFTYADFGFDLALCASLLLLTGGLRSPFLLYCLCPILTSGLFFSQKLTFSITSIPLLSLIVSQLLLNTTSPAMAFYPLELSVTLLGAIIVASFLIAWLPYLMNINASQTMRTQAILNERRRLSQEMHDGVAQSLGIASWKVELLQQSIAAGKTLEALAEVIEIKGLVEEAQQELKEAIDELHASQQRFIPALAQYATEFTRSCGVRCELHMADGQVNLPLTAELELLRIVREALANVRKHAAASKVEVTFESKPDTIEMTIRDNGRGFAPQADFAGHGLTIMAERARSLGGELVVNTHPGEGTDIKVRLGIPLTPLEGTGLTRKTSARLGSR